MTIIIKPVVLLAEDSPNDVILARFAIDTADLDCRLFPVNDGEDAVRYLSGDALTLTGVNTPSQNWCSLI